ncbi:MAG: hypothetical protein PHO10_00945 [Gemmiger sp.]|nr:hypothetical protein [Gemmiger sp.]
MSWILIALVALAAIVAVCILVKIHLKKRLDSIDGLNGVFKEDQTGHNGTTIGSFGDEEPKDRNK